MRTFIAACVVAGIIAVGAAIVLDNFVQESSKPPSRAPAARGFSTGRLNPDRQARVGSK